MKQLKYYIGILVIIIGGIIYFSNQFLGIDLIEMINPDTTAPEIDTSAVRNSIPVI